MKEVIKQTTIVDIMITTCHALYHDITKCSQDHTADDVYPYSTSIVWSVHYGGPFIDRYHYDNLDDALARHDSLVIETTKYLHDYVMKGKML